VPGGGSVEQAAHRAFTAGRYVGDGAQQRGGTLERFQDKPASQRESSELVGPYVLLAEIGRGELTTVYLAKKQGVLGFQRLYALKRLKPALVRNADSIELVLDEARLVSGLHHANIAGVLDVGTDGGNYVVMDYVEGENLELLLARSGAARHPRYIVPAFVDALNGLHALHTATDADGEPFAIVHQAPRARHIVVGVDGTSRLVDFSQVRGKDVRPTRARSDRIKVAYMAPEQALHPDGVDLRSDLFIIGVTLWEALTGEHLFGADTDELTFQNMLHRRIPRPSDVGLRPPRCFDAICMRALERDPKSRYPSAQEMARDLRDTAINQALYATASELGQWVRQLAGSDLRKLRKLAGQEPPSSGGILLETPVAGVDLSGLRRASGQADGSGLARLSDGLVVLPSKAEADAREPGAADNPYATGRIYGGSEARVRREGLPEDRTPALGMRRDKPLPREEEDDDPTGPRALPGAAGPVYDARARAETVPLAAAAAGGGAVVRADGDQDETNPAVFVPARPGARRDTNRPSPGSYSQVDGTRRQSKTRAPNTELEIPNAKALLAAEARGSAREQNKETPAFEEADTTLRPQLAPRPEDEVTPAPKRRAETKSYVAARFNAETSDKAASVEAGGSAREQNSQRRSGGVTEHPPTYVQRRDSSPTRMEIPVGPVGSPHRPFAPERMPEVARAPRGSSHPFDMPLEAGAAGMNAGVLPDSLTPPASAARTAPPDAPPMARPSALWLVSGVLAAIILLALGVGLKQWVAGGPPARPPVSHAASGGRGSSDESKLREEPPAPATPTPAAPSALVPVPAEASEQRATPTASPRHEPARPAATPSETKAPRTSAAKRNPVKTPRPTVSEPKRESPTSGLPDNPY
jgi:serine/threonine protein kinase